MPKKTSQAEQIQSLEQQIAALKNEFKQQTEALKSSFAQQISALRAEFQSPPLLWTVQDIADFLKIALVTAKTRVVVKEDFPESFSITNSEEKIHRRWFANEVIEWARTNRKPRKPVKP